MIKYLVYNEYGLSKAEYITSKGEFLLSKILGNGKIVISSRFDAPILVFY